MTSSTLAPDARRSVGLFSSGILVADHKPKISFGKSTKSEKLVLKVVDMPVFRSGTFRDSMGYQHTWEDLHIDQMVMHYDHLKKNNVFADVPVRKGHGSFFEDPMNSLIGWHEGLRAETMTSAHDGNDYHYLLASFEIFDEEAAKRVEDGDWRNRSSEVGFYLTNAEAEFWPVYQGFAYVDIPAVEGLNGFSKAIKPRSNFSMMIEEEVADMGDENSNPATPAAPEQPAAPAQDPAPEQTDSPQAPAPAAAAAPEQPVQAAPAVPTTQPAEPQGQHAAQGQAFAFRVNGQTVSDFSAVQAHIDTLEAANIEREKVVRGDFVKGLARDGKISAVQIDALTNHAQGLTPESYAAWAKSYDDVPASGLFGQYGASGGDKGGAPVSTPGGGDVATEISKLEGVVAMHSRTMTKDQLENTESYKRLQTLRGQQA